MTAELAADWFIKEVRLAFIPIPKVLLAQVAGSVACLFLTGISGSCVSPPASCRQVWASGTGRLQLG